MRMFKLASVLWIILAGHGFADGPEQGIIVSGVGQVAMAPDMARVSLGVAERAKTAEQAMAANAAAVAEILARLDEAGVAKSDRQTSQFYLNPLRSNYDNANAPTFTGYEAGNQITVKINDLSRLGATLDAVIDAGANRFNGISFDLKDDSVAKSKARAAAVKDAMTRAEELAQSAGINVGGVMRLTEQSFGQGPSPMMMARSEGAMQSAIAEGEVQVTVQVSMVFAILP